MTRWAPRPGLAADNLRWIAEAKAGPGPVARFCGRLGPSLFMTAVERRDQQQKGREALERIGRGVQRILGMTAEERARNDLPPRQSLREALAAPAGRFADLLAEGLQEGAERGDRATKAHARARLRALAVPGLDPGANLAQPCDSYGWRGLTTAGRRSIRDAGAVLDEDRGCLGFWTVTLPAREAETATRAQIATFQKRLLFFTRRALIRRGLDPLILLVCEMHPHRRSMDGAPIPHWHGVVRTKQNRFEQYRLTVSDWHRLVDQAHLSAFGRRRGHTHGCKMLRATTGAARYLAPYMAKDRSRVEQLQDTQQGRMIPRKWWTWTGELRARVEACRMRPPSAFLAWCCRWRVELEDLGELAQTGPVQIGEDGATVGRWFVWASEEALDRALEAWLGEELARLDWLRWEANGTGPPDCGKPGESRECERNLAFT